MVDWNGLAEMAPVLAAGFTGKPDILQNTMQSYGVGKKVRDDQALRSFGRELFSLGHPPDEMEIQNLASKYGLDPLVTQALVKKAMDDKQQSRMMQLKEGEATLNREKFDESNRQFGVEQETERSKIEALKQEKEQNRTAKQVENVAQGLKWDSQQEATKEYRNDNLELRRDALQQRGESEGTITPVGLDPKSNRAVSKNRKGELFYQDTKEPYTGGQLKNIVEPAMTAILEGAESWNEMPDDVKNFWYEQYSKDTKNVPQLYYRDPVSKMQFTKGFAEWGMGGGKTGTDVAAERIDTKALSSSLLQQQKNRGMVGSFVKNIDKQVDKIGKLMDDVINRVGARALDIPLRTLNVTFKGSGHERVLEAYMKEVSAEIAKLSQGSAASIAQLPEGNREEWERIHDVNLSLNEMKKILDGTNEMAKLRLESYDEELEETRGNIKKSFRPGQKKSAAPQASQGGGLNLDMDAIQEELRRRKGAGQ